MTATLGAYAFRVLGLGRAFSASFVLPGLQLQGFLHIRVLGFRVLGLGSRV